MTRLSFVNALLLTGCWEREWGWQNNTPAPYDKLGGEGRAIAPLLHPGSDIFESPKLFCQEFVHSWSPQKYLEASCGW